MRRPPNRHDPHGYYCELGVCPDATDHQIRVAVRALFHRLHPDTGIGDVERLQRVKNIAEVLLNPISRELYNRTPEGRRLLDAVYMDELSRVDEFYDLGRESVIEALRPIPAVPRGAHYDYLADHEDCQDFIKAAAWYEHLVEVAPLVRYRRIIKVLLCDESEPGWIPAAAILVIPRSWEPSTACAFALFVVAAGCTVWHGHATREVS